MIASGTLGRVDVRGSRRRAVAAWGSLFQGAETVGFLRKPNALGFFFASLRKTLCAAEDASALPLASGNADARRGRPAPQSALTDAAAPVMHGKRMSYRE
jgi:hypothetical protein